MYAAQCNELLVNISGKNTPTRSSHKGSASHITPAPSEFRAELINMGGACSGIFVA